MATLSKSDLDFILQQILIAEAHAAGADLTTLLPNAFAPLGLRTVDGTYNNLLAGQSEFGAADTVFPRMLDPVLQDAQAGTSYTQTSGLVIDSEPRTISNLIVDMTANNPSAVAAAAANPGSEVVISPGLDGVFGTADDKQVFQIPNVTPDFGLTAPFNGWFTFFGQFFDHGLDLVNKGGNGTVFIPLQADDPLFVPGSPTNFMVLTRATNDAVHPGADGLLGTADDIHDHINQTTPFVDQNQTYTSHPSHQVFLREYALVAGKPVATGNLLEHRTSGADGILGTADDVIQGLPTWAEVKAQARTLLGITLTDADVTNLPLLATDPYGKFLPGAHGFAQLVTASGLVEGVAGGLAIPANVVRTSHPFLVDIAHAAAPTFTTAGALNPDADTLVGNAQTGGTYDNELLDAHFITGDGRGNENIGLTSVHFIFHAEHNRQVAEVKNTVLATADPTYIAQWLLPGANQADGIQAGEWNGERLFQAARFATEMQYQHLVFEEFARTVQPQVDAFLAPIGYDATINPAIVAEFAHVVYRFGHSMLTETVDRFDPSFNVIDADPLHPAQDASNHQIGLIAAFLNPLAFAASGNTQAEAAGAVIRGMTRQVGNEIDEFVTEALRNNLVGLPLDLAAINMARGRDTGVPSLNAARREFYAMTGDSQLTPYTSWLDFTQHLKHETSVINFIAAYGTHSGLTALDVDTLVEKRAVATALVLGGSAVINVGTPEERTFVAADADRLAFLNSTGAYANLPTGVTTTGVDDIDLWVGGLAEKQMAFGGLLGSTFNFVFETQMENLQNGDRFYYLSRTAGLNFGTQLENNSFAELVMLNTNATHLPANIFLTPAFILEVDPTKQFTGLGLDGRADPTEGAPPLAPFVNSDTTLTPLVMRDDPATPGPDAHYLRYTGWDTVVLGGTPGNDTLIAGYSDDDTVYGDAGNDRLDGGMGADNIFGGPGDDIITDPGGDDVIHGDDGNDVIHGGNGLNLILGGAGSDFIVTGEDISTVFAGSGNDFILGAKTNLQMAGNEGDDWIEIGHQDGSVGDNFDPNGLDTVIGNDVFLGGGGFEDIIAEGGDDIVFGSDGQEKVDAGSGFDWIDYKFETSGVAIDLLRQTFNTSPATPSTSGILDLFQFVEGMSGSAFADVLRGDDSLPADIVLAGAQGSVLTNIGLIDGLQALLGPGVTSFRGGNIILGGDGSDILEGRMGDDILDGDRWLNVRISVRDPNNHSLEIRSVDSMKDLVTDMLAGTINPGQLEIVREIKTAAGPDFDTAIFSGPRANYTISTAFDGTTVVHDNVGTLRGNDGTDTLRNIERLQFSDQAAILPGGAGLDVGPAGLLQIRDAATNAVDNTPAVNQVLRVSPALVTDADNVSATNPTGAITAGPITYIWQFERIPGSGYFEDIFVPAGLGGAPTSAQGPTLRVPDAVVGIPLTGLALRVHAIYLDAHGVLENAYSAATAPVAGVIPVPPPAAVPAETPIANLSGGAHFIRSDLQFILDQIVIAEQHAAGQDLLSLLPNERVPFGLRTVDGTFNNLVQGQTNF
ncbi:MAG: peroxidase family protein, partial [Acidimicrobiia bacterium]